MKNYLLAGVLSVCLTSCLKQSIPDAMLDIPEKNGVTATMSYEINGQALSVTVKNADDQIAGSRKLYCQKVDFFTYVLGATLTNYADFQFSFYTDSLKVGNYKNTRAYGAQYVTTFQGYPSYIWGPSDNLSVNITSFRDGHISGNFTGQITPALMQSYPDNIYGPAGSIIIKNGKFENVPVTY